MTAERKEALSRAKAGKMKANSGSFQKGSVPHNKSKKADAVSCGVGALSNPRS
jgi:hypothetical protein